MTEPSSAEASRDLAREVGKVARIHRMAEGSYIASADEKHRNLFHGTQRMADANRPEEAGAVCIIEAVAGGASPSTRQRTDNGWPCGACRENAHGGGSYSGNVLLMRVTYLMPGGAFGLAGGNVVMALKPEPTA